MISNPNVTDSNCERTLYNSIMIFSAILSGVGILVMTLIICYELVARLLGHPTIWVTELSEHLMVFCAFLGMGYTQWQKGHINVDVITNKMSISAQKFLGRIALSLTVFVCGILTWKGLELSLHYLTYRSASDWAPPLFPVYIWIPFGYFLVLLAALISLVRS